MNTLDETKTDISCQKLLPIASEDVKTNGEFFYNARWEYFICIWMKEEETNLRFVQENEVYPIARSIEIQRNEKRKSITTIVNENLCTIPPIFKVEQW